MDDKVESHISLTPGSTLKITNDFYSKYITKIIGTNKRNGKHT